jgi:hypothetical protein
MPAALSREAAMRSYSPHWLIKSSFAQCFYVSKSAPRLAARIRSGLEQMTQDDSFDAFFNGDFAKLLVELKLKERVLVELYKPDLPPWVPLARQGLWFDPKQLR